MRSWRDGRLGALWTVGGIFTAEGTLITVGRSSDRPISTNHRKARTRAMRSVHIGVNLRVLRLLALLCGAGQAQEVKPEMDFRIDSVDSTTHIMILTDDVSMTLTSKPYTQWLEDIQNALVYAHFSLRDAERAVSAQYIGLKLGGKIKSMSRHLLDADVETLAKHSLRTVDRDEAEDQAIQDDLNQRFYAAIRAYRIKEELKKTAPKKRKR